MFQGVKDGIVQADIAKSAEKIVSDFKDKKIVSVGTNKYTVSPIERLNETVIFNEDVEIPFETGIIIKPLKFFRPSRIFE